MSETTSDPVIESTLAYPVSGHLVPSKVSIEGRYEVRFARDLKELDELLELRFKVFNLELGEGLEESYATGQDRDPFDAVCHHLIVIERATSDIVGTYRMQTNTMAQENIGYYSHAEFDLNALPETVLHNSVEVGRACVALEHRNRQVLFLLWKGLAHYLLRNQMRFLFGCCSLTSQHLGEALAVMNYLRQHRHLHPELEVTPQPGFECFDNDSENDPDFPVWTEKVKIPKLFRTYLRHGAKVCGAPAIDREFKTIDYLVLFDVAAMDEKRLRTFFG